MSETQNQLPLSVSFEDSIPSGWDDFAMKCEPAHFEQTSWWAAVESVDGWTAKYVVCRDGGQIVAGSLVLVRWRKWIGNVGYIFRGPLIRGDLEASGQVRAVLSAALKKFAHKEHLIVLVVVPGYDSASLVQFLHKQGFLIHAPMFPPKRLALGTLTIDLRQGYKAIEQNFRSTIKKQIKSAQKKGLDVKLGTEQDLARFWSKHLDLCERLGVSSNVPGFEYVCRVWREFHQCKRAWMFNVALDGKVLCSLICLATGSWFYAWRIGWTETPEKLYPTQLVYARAIQTAVEAGYNFFDFMDIDPKSAGNPQRGETAKKNSWAMVFPKSQLSTIKRGPSGMTFFKLGFGGQVRSFPPTLDWFPNPQVRLIGHVFERLY